MTRRELMLLLGGAMSAPHALRAQQRTLPVIPSGAPLLARMRRLWPRSAKD
jgi:hypothetical protein